MKKRIMKAESGNGINRKKLIIICIIIAATLTVIWGHSFMSQEESAEESGFVFEFLKPFLEFFVGEGNATELFVRKAAHFTEFFVLGFEWLIFMRTVVKDRICSDEKKDKKTAAGVAAVRIVNAWFLGTMCAAVDETIQIFSGRGSSLLDVWLDSAGCLTALLLSIPIFYCHFRHREP